MDQNIQNIVLIKNSRTAWPFLTSLDNYYQDAYDAYIIFQKGVDIFETEHKTCHFLVRGALPP